jgi:hypothetical protein
MKKFAVGFFLLSITLIIGVFSFDLLQKPADVFISPNGKYKVKLYGYKQRPWFFANIITANIFSGEQMMSSEGLHSLSKQHSTRTFNAHIGGKFKDGEKIESGTSFQSMFVEKLFAENPIRLCVSVENYQQNSINQIVKVTDCSL